MCCLVPLVNGLRVGLLADDLFPDFEISGDVRFAVLLPFDTSEEDEKVGGLAEDSSGGGGLKVGSAEVVVEALQASAFGEMLALRLADAGEDVEVCGEPAVVFGEEMGNELAGIVGAGSGEISPGDLGPGSSGDDDVSRANADLATVEIEGGGVGEQSSESGRAQEGEPGFGVVLGQSPVEAGYWPDRCTSRSTRLL